MKNKLVIIAGIAALVAVNSAQAIPDTLTTGNILNGTAYLPTGSPGYAGDDIYVNYAVNLIGNVYTYNYQIFDASGVDSVEALNVAFNTSATGALIAGNYTGSNPGSLSWTAGNGSPLGLSLATTSSTLSIDLYFTSYLAPQFGNANGSDANPPSPWASYPNGQQVPVPALPDGGATVLLLGAALSAMGMVRKKLIA